VYGEGCYAAFTRARRLAGSSRVALVRFAQPAGEFPDPPTDDFTLALNERGGGRMRFDIGTGRRELPFRRGDLVLKGPRVATFFAVDSPHQKSFLSLPTPLVVGLAEETGTRGFAGSALDFRHLHDDAFRAPALAQLLDLIWAEPDTESAHARLFNDGAALAVLATLFRLAAAPLPEAVPGLGPARLARVRAFVAANLAEPFGIEEMARAAGLSVWHFSRAFKASLGQTPRAFVTAQRLARAKELLAQSALPLAQVAQDCGFADQAHFTRVFSREVGTTPGAYRRGRA
jgi:AraC family transcriptional regulator